MDNDYLFKGISNQQLFLQWRRDVSFAGFGVSIQMDVSAEKMIFGVSGIDANRRGELIKVR